MGIPRWKLTPFTANGAMKTGMFNVGTGKAGEYNVLMDINRKKPTDYSHTNCLSPVVPLVLFVSVLKPKTMARGSCLCASNSARRSFCSSACCVCRFLPDGLFIIIGKKTKLEKSWQVCVACHKTMSSLIWSSSRSRLNLCLRSTQ